jgi:hypothetical protein
MSVKSFKFVSPGVFINEIDNSFIPRSAGAIGPVVIGRSQRGLAMQPTKVESFSEFVELFGDTVPGKAGGDISRDGNLQSPMYGTYAAKAFLVSNVAPLTYIRVLGEEKAGTDTAGWQTENQPNTSIAANGGAYGLWVWPSASFDTAAGLLGTGSLAAVWYLNSGSSIQLSGTLWGSGAASTSEGIGTVIASDSNHFTVRISSSGPATDDKLTFGFSDASETFVRKVFNTNPQLASDAGTFYAAESAEPYWLGETYEQEVRDAGLESADMLGAILPIADSAAHTTIGPAIKKTAHREAYTGWFIGQDLKGVAADFNVEAMPKLFRLIGRGHGSWLSENAKVSIEKIRASTTTTSDYGSFSVVIRALGDTDGKTQVLERFDNLNLNPSSPDFISRRIGDTYQEWNETERRMVSYGDYPNQSKYIYIQCQSDVEDGGANPLLLPFGYFGPPKYKTVASTTTGALGAGMIYWDSGLVGAGASPLVVSASSTPTAAMAGFAFPEVRLRVSASDGGLSDFRNAYFGYQNTRAETSSRADASVKDVNKLLDGNVTALSAYSMEGTGNYRASYVFTMNDIRKDSSDEYYYESGSYASGDSVSITGGGTYKTLLDAGYDRFTAPLVGGFDGFDILVPDPLYNGGMPVASTTENNNSAYYSIKRAIDTVADPESVDINLMALPGITNESLTNHMIDVCEDRGDAMALIDLKNIYIPQHEQYESDKKDRFINNVGQTATDLKDRRIDSSYGATFYPWVQTRDANSGRALWVPPTVAMMGVLASSQAQSHLWFAPAGFNRGGLSDGAAGIPVTNVSQKLTSKERDKLYESNINPIASFPSSGIVVFGQKTLQERQSALDRINVRRLVIYLKKQISILSTQILFEQNVQSTWNRFTSVVEPFLSNVKVQFGITDYRLILDETTTTPDLIDQNIMYAKIMVKPARAIEYIAIDFVIASTGASFDD